MLEIWLKNIFNHIIALEEFPECLKDGLVVPVYIRQGKYPLLVSSYRGITLSSVLSKNFLIILLQCLSSLLDEHGFPDQLQTAYRFMHGCYLCHSRDPYKSPLRWWTGLPLSNWHWKSFRLSGVSYPTTTSLQYRDQWEVLEINKKVVYQLNQSCSCPPSTSCLNHSLVKQGSVLSPTLFLIATPKAAEREELWSLCVPDLCRCSNPCWWPESYSCIKRCPEPTSKSNHKFCHLKLYASKLEVVRVSKQHKDLKRLDIAGVEIKSTPASKCLDVW